MAKVNPIIYLSVSNSVSQGVRGKKFRSCVKKGAHSPVQKWLSLFSFVPDIINRRISSVIRSRVTPYLSNLTVVVYCCVSPMVFSQLLFIVLCRLRCSHSCCLSLCVAYGVLKVVVYSCVSPKVVSQLLFIVVCRLRYSHSCCLLLCIAYGVLTVVVYSCVSPKVFSKLLFIVVYHLRCSHSCCLLLCVP